MRTDARGAAGGFTLVEVLVALVVLCFGLLALEALSVVVARGITRAERESEWALAAGARAEQALDSLRTGCLGAHPLAIVELRGAAPAQDTLLREITEVDGLYAVHLAMRPARGGGLVRPDTFTLRADAFLPEHPACAP